MNILSRPQRIFWVLGILLLVGTVAGAGWFFNHTDKDGSPTAPYEADFIIATGHADLVQGMAKLFPVQPGRVTAIYVADNDAVSEGQLLFSTDNRLSRQKWQEAQADLQAARDNVRKAELAVRIHQLQIDQQKIKIEGTKIGVNVQRNALAAKEKLAFGLSPEEIYAAREQVKAEQAKVTADQKTLEILQRIDPSIEVDRAKQDVKAKEARLEQARIGVLEHDVYAPSDGTILRLMISKGELSGSQSQVPALLFCPQGERIIRAEVQQEWSGKVAVGQTATVEDESRAGFKWEGKVMRVADMFTHRRSIIQEPFQLNDVRTLECLISVKPGSHPLRIGQRVRVIIKQGGP